MKTILSNYSHFKDIIKRKGTFLLLLAGMWLSSCNPTDEGYKWLVAFQENSDNTSSYIGDGEIQHEFSYDITNMRGDPSFLLDLDGSMDVFTIVLNGEDPQAGSLVQIREMTGDRLGRVIFQGTASETGNARGRISINTVTDQAYIELNYEDNWYYYSLDKVLSMVQINATFYINSRITSADAPLDSDEDGVRDDEDVCPEDPNKTTDAGDCGCGVPETDGDEDGITDCIDEFPNDADNDGITTAEDCDDLNAEIGGESTWYADADGDGLGIAGDQVTACDQPEGYVENADDENDNDFDNDGVETDLDCDDQEPAVGEPLTWYADADGDGLGISEDQVTACEQPEGYVGNSDDENDNDFDNDGVETELDCDDQNPGVGEPLTWYQDEDGDGFGNPAVSLTTCDPPSDYTLDGNDTDDTNEFINPNNAAPFADAGADQTVFIGETVQLDGSSSSDPDGDLISYYWQFELIPAGSAAQFSDESVVNPSFTADEAGEFVISLIVNDGPVDSDPDEVLIYVQSQEEALSDLIGQIQVLLSEGVINKGQARALTSKLDAAIKKFKQGNDRAAVNMLGAFKNQVNAFIRSGKFSSTDGEEMIDAVDKIINSVNAGKKSAIADKNKGKKKSKAVAILEQMEVYPNPFTTSLHFDITPAEESQVTVRLYDFSGSLVHTIYEGKVNPAERYRWDYDSTDKLKRGMYFLQIISDGTSTTKKIIFDGHGK